MCGATFSHGGVPIIALPSTAAGGTVSRITASRREGTGVVATELREEPRERAAERRLDHPFRSSRTASTRTPRQ
ncbi:MAG TPA: acetyl-CoA hydrolase/transferase C-terminal domain-containing protein [Thermoanaerobaculia bacterium]|nr:acetyl-CoA hydrolase/transferase C-terminal domain-containing protein [Thermoanaerobaculia bacterium]